MHEKQRAQDVCPNCGFNPATYKWPSYALEPYTILNGKYLIGRVLGAGGFGITYIAYDMMLECTRAIKEFFLQGSMYRMSSESTGVSVVNGSFPQEQMYKVNREKFIQEARLLAKLDHLPGIVGVYDFFNENDTSYMVLEYLEGMTLKDYVKSRGGRLDYQEVLEKIHPVIKSLQHLHDRGVYHRDISPDNIMVMKDGSLKLFDFGGARVRNANNDNRSVMVMKKSGYTPVEQYVDGEQGPWTDEYAMAATIYYCICGTVPPESVTRTAGEDPLKAPSQLIRGLPDSKETAIMKGLGLRKEDRYPDMYAFEEALYKETGKDKKKPGGGKHGGSNGSNGSGGSGGGKKALIIIILLALLGGGGYAAYHFLGGSAKKSYEVTVINGRTSAVISSYSYETGSMVTVEADDMQEQGYGFEKWTGDTSPLDLEEDALLQETLQFKMPDQKISLRAQYVGLPADISLDGSDPDITITADPQQDTYLTGDKVTLTAQVADGWDFAGWTCDNDAAQFSDPDSETTVFTVPAGGGTVSAQKVPHAWTLTVENGVCADGAYAYHEGEQAAIIADQPAEGERFVNWTVEGADAGILKDAQSERTSLTMPAADITVRANFSEKTYGLFIPEDCTVLEGEAQEDGTYKAGTQITVEASVEDGYKFDRWEILGNGELPDTDLTQNPLTFTMPASELSLVAKTTENKVYVSAVGAKGYKQPSAFHPGDTVTLEADVETYQAKGKAFDRWSITGAELDLEESVLQNPVLTFTMPDTDVEVEAQYIDIDYYVTVRSDLDDSSDVLTFHMGDDVILEAEPEDAASDQRFSGWTVDVGDVEAEYSGTSESVISFTMPGGDITLTKHYEPIKHTLTVKTIEGEQQYEYAMGDSAGAETVSVQDGMRFVRWKVTKGTLDLGESVLTNPKLSFIMPSEDVTIEAQYEEIEYTVTVTYDADGETTQFSYHKGDQVTIEAVDYAELDLALDYWTVDSGNIELEDDHAETIGFEMPDANVTLTAHYKAAEHTLTITLDGVDNTYSFLTGDEVAFETSDEYNGMHFVCWTVETGNVTLEDPMALKVKFDMPAEDVILQLHYGYVVTVEGGVIEGSEEQNTIVAEVGAEVAVQAQLSDNRYFESWDYPEDVTFTQTGELTGSLIMPDHDIVVTARFIERYEGTYVLYRKENPALVAGTYVHAGYEGAELLLQEDQELNNQKFYIQYQEETDNYKIVMMSNQKLVTETSDGQCGLYNDTNADGQFWTIETQDDETVLFCSASGKYLDLNGNDVILSDTRNGWRLAFTAAQDESEEVWEIGQVISLDDGTFSLESAANEGYFLTVEDNFGISGSNIVVAENQDMDYQKFNIVNQDAFTYLQGLNSGLFLDAGPDMSDSVSNLIQSEFDETAKSQQWNILYAGRDLVALQSAGGSLITAEEETGDHILNGYLDKNAFAETGSMIPAQKWRLIPAQENPETPDAIVEGSEVYIEDGATWIITGSTDENLAMTVNGESLQDGAKIILWQNLGKESQKFSLERDEEGYRIRCIGSGKYLEAVQQGDGTFLIQRARSDQPEQLFRLLCAGIRVYYLSSVNGEAAGYDSTGEGVNFVEFHPLDYADNQQWVLSKTE